VGRRAVRRKAKMGATPADFDRDKIRCALLADTNPQRSELLGTSCSGDAYGSALATGGISHAAGEHAAAGTGGKARQGWDLCSLADALTNRSAHLAHES
jgi:hypothetical protein